MRSELSHQAVVLRPGVYQEENRLILACEKHQELLKRAASARREHEESKYKADTDRNRSLDSLLGCV
jgi:hypothetical protein